LTQVQTAEQLSITARHLRREQRHAVRVLACSLVEQAERRSPPDHEPSGLARDWHAQVQQEVAVLERQAPAATADLSTSLDSVFDLARHVTKSRDIEVLPPALPADLTVALHPALLRQLLLVPLTSLAGQIAAGGRITVEISAEGTTAQLRLVPRPLRTEADVQATVTEQMQPLIRASNVHVVWEATDDVLRIDLPLTHELPVLVIDDNDDLVHVFRRYVKGTAFTIDHVKTEDATMEAIETRPPAVIVLDIMLPETDGWELLVHLHEHPVARDIPLLVCSVVRERDLALALGAQAYLPKPVRRRDFIQALATAVAPSTPGLSRTPAPS
jgi:CheY-like chemotaxis protein